MQEPPPESVSPVAEGPAAACPEGARWWWAVVLILAVMPSWGTVDAPLIAEDAGILRHVHREGALDDWTGPQYGLHLLAFWRPLVSSSWAWQEATTGVDAEALRILNILCHALAAVAVGFLARRLGASGLGALVAGGMAALFPEQGGTVTWVAGRTDGLVSLLMVLACILALDRRAVLAFATAFLACATKEMAFMLPFWAALLIWARGASSAGVRADWIRGFVPLVVAVGIAFAWRRVALGVWVGGYLAAPPVGLLEIAPGAALGWLRMSALTLAGLGVAVALGALVRTWRPRLFLAGLGCALFGAAPMLPILRDGVLSEQNIRLLRVSDLGLCLAAASAFAVAAPRTSRWLVALPAAVLLALGGIRGAQAVLDTHEWAQAGHVAEAAIQRARDEVAADPVGDLPAFHDGFPGLHGGAYCLGYGIADRFAVPFPVSPRPVWPLRLLFQGPERARASVAPVRNGFVRPEERNPHVALLEVTVDGAAPGAIPVDIRAIDVGEDTSPRFEIHGRFPDAWFEFVLYTELGYEPAPWRVAGDAEVHAITLRELCALSEEVVARPAEVLFQTADFGATRAWLEVRAVRITDGVVLATSPFLALEWDADVLDRLDG